MGNVNQRLSKQYKNDPIMELTKLGWNSGLDQQFAPYNAKEPFPRKTGHSFLSLRETTYEPGKAS
jgi:hypothetical protein